MTFTVELEELFTILDIKHLIVNNLEIVSHYVDCLFALCVCVCVCVYVCVCVCVCAVGIIPSALYMLGKHSTSELHTQSWVF
jgi:hypothetical protein